MMCELWKAALVLLAAGVIALIAIAIALWGTR